MYILGVHIGHDSSAALIQDGKVVAMAAEERFVRIKHYCGLPFQAIEFCLADAGLAGTDIDVVAFSQTIHPWQSKLLFDGPEFVPGPSSLKGRVKRAISPALDRRLFDRPRMGLPLYLKPIQLKESVEYQLVAHHLAHAASAYYTSKRQLDENVTIITMDGMGDSVSCAAWRGQHGKIDLIEKYGTDSSVGFFYSNVTEALGWWHGDGEGKTMGLAPYGDPTVLDGRLDQYCPRFEGGRLVKGRDFGELTYLEIAGGRHHSLPDSTEIAKLLHSHSREDLAAVAQAILEREASNFILPRLAEENTSHLACAGGIFLNVKLNQVLWESGKIDSFHIYPDSGDAGLSVGAGLFAYHEREPKALLNGLETAYTGPQFSDAVIAELLDQRGLEYERVDDVASEVAKDLSQNRIIGWLQGRMECGPRALGNRSILMNAGDPSNKDILNARVKFREGFRPFCPSLTEGARSKYLTDDRLEEYMITGYRVKPGKEKDIPAVSHVDGTVRPQMVRQSANPLFHDLLTKFGALTGEELLLNTSFNVMGEPVINEPRHAIRCFFDSGIDTLAMGSIILRK